MVVGAGVLALARLSARLRCSAEETDGAAHERPSSLESGAFLERRFGGCEGISDLHAGATFITRRNDELVEHAARHVVSERGVVSLGGAPRHVAVLDAQLVDNADEWTGTDRWTDRENPDADQAPLRDRNDDRRRGNEEKMSEPVRLVALLLPIGRVARNQAYGGVDIGQAGAADGYLHGASRERNAARGCLTYPYKDSMARPGTGL